jgi:flagellar biosynthesis chaperone FliJ
MDREFSRAARLIEVRERERAAALTELQRALADEAVAIANEQAARAALVEAERVRAELAHGPSLVVDYLSQEDWLETLALRHALARHKLQQARGVVRRHQARVKAAQMRLKQAELLRERLEQARRARLLRIERRAEDEIAQRIANSSRTES